MHDDSTLFQAAPAPAAAPARSRGSHPLASLALVATMACGLVGTAAAQSFAAERAPMAKSAATTTTEPAKSAKWKQYFSAEEVGAWEKKLAAAPDEAERRRIRGQRLAEIRRRTKAQQAGGAAPMPKATSTAAQRQP